MFGINPVLPLLILISCIGLFYKRKGLGIAFFVLGISATALLLPSLLIPDGIPSPASDLRNIVPWEQAIKDEGGNPSLRDMTHQMHPWFMYLRTELREGRIPFWNPHQFSGYPYYTDGGTAPLFPLHLLFVILPLQFAFIFLPWLKIVIGGLGVWYLAREIGLGEKGALLACLIYPLSGLPIVWIYAPMGSTLALVPWVLWAVERISNGKGGWQFLSIAVALQLLSGHPETVIHTAMLSGIYLLVRGSNNLKRSWSYFVIGWVIGAAISAVYTIPFLFTMVESGKWLYEPETTESFFIPPVKILVLWVRIVLPQIFGHPAFGTWWGPFNYSGSALYVGAITIPLAACALKSVWKDRKWIAIIAILIFSVLTASALPGIYTLINSLPILDEVIHHRLRFGLALALALLSGLGLELWLKGRGKGLLLGSIIVVGLLSIAWIGLGGELAQNGLILNQVKWTIWVFSTVLVLSLTLLTSLKFRHFIWPLLPLIIIIDLVAAHGRINPGVSLKEFYPTTPAIEFLKDKPGRVAGIADAFHPNAAMVYGLYDIRGDDVIKYDRYEKIYSQLSGEYHPYFFRHIQNWESPWIKELGVRWVIAPPNQQEVLDSWEKVYSGEDASIYELRDSKPIVRWKNENSDAQLNIEDKKPGYWLISWSSPLEQELIIAENWDKGWQATISTDPGASFTPDRVDDILMGVKLGAGSGYLELKYLPRGIFIGLTISLFALGILLVSLMLRLRKIRQIE